MFNCVKIKTIFCLNPLWVYLLTEYLFATNDFAALYLELYVLLPLFEPVILFNIIPLLLNKTNETLIGILVS